MLEARNMLFNIKFVSTRLGLVRTATKGKIDTTPMVSSNAMIVIIKINKPNCFCSRLESKNKNFLIVLIKL